MVSKKHAFLDCVVAQTERCWFWTKDELGWTDSVVLLAALEGEPMIIKVDAGLTRMQGVAEGSHLCLQVLSRRKLLRDRRRKGMCYLGHVHFRVLPSPFY